MAVSDYSLRETLSEELDQLAEASQGAKGTRAGKILYIFISQLRK